MRLPHIYVILSKSISKMSILRTCDLKPVGVRGMKYLDRDKFEIEITVPVLRVKEEWLSKLTPLVKNYFLKIENFKPIQSDNTLSTDDNNTQHNKYIYLDPKKVSSWTDFPDEFCAKMNSYGVDSIDFMTKNIQLGYKNWCYDEIFKSVLPEGEETVSGFSQIGHIIHLNLREHLLEYKKLIGEVLLDKVKTCRTVVNKSNIIDNTYRNFSMEVLAGEENFLVNVKENRCNFQFDFSKVYWNPRLAMEHERIISFIKPNDVLFDVFCGIGPFSIPAAKKKCRVFANDLNPDSYKWLCYNAEKNKLNMKLFKPYNLDGKDFICSIFKEYLESYCKGMEHLDDNSKIHITMNLPAMAVEFLQYFKGLIKDKEITENFKCDITVYVYCFVFGEDLEEIKSAAKELVIKNIGYDISSSITDVFVVRNVSPKKEMMRVTFNLTKDIIFADSSSDNCEPPTKKVCTES